MNHDQRIKLFLWIQIALAIGGMIWIRYYLQFHISSLLAYALKIILFIYLAILVRLLSCSDISQTFIQLFKNIASFFTTFIIIIIFTGITIIMVYFPSSPFVIYLLFLLVEYLFVDIMTRYFLPIIYITPHLQEFNKGIIYLIEKMSWRTKLLLGVAFMLLPAAITFLIFLKH